jgi:hypothetical protein
VFLWRRNNAPPAAQLGIPWQRSYRPSGTQIHPHADTRNAERPFADTLPALRFVLFGYLRRHQLWVGSIRRGLVLEDAMVQIFAVTGPQRLGLD